ncbi:MAG: 16S rRNA (uracil(1498)-N(3))-methyltransferase [Candidatus Paceibacterota bacterium]|jgi:16S rRNA (uracil1498-N3)-methyltransferase
MRLHNFFIDQKLGEVGLVPRSLSEVGETVVIKDSALVGQWRNVLRLQIGARVVLLDNSGFEFVSMITDFQNGEATVQILEKIENQNIPENEIYLFPSLIKKDNLEWVIEKGTELGVSFFQPIITERSEKKSFNLARAKKIIKEASEQSGRGIMPGIGELQKMEDAFSNYEMTWIAFHPDGEEFHKELFDHVKRVGILIGPEGGFSDPELEFFRKSKIKIFSMGKQTLRAETASIIAAAMFLF